MTKEDKIQEAWNKIGVTILYGVCMDTGYSETIENNISDLLDYHSISINDIDFEKIGGEKIKYRPSCLKGIENNNGWYLLSEKIPKIGDKIIAYRNIVGHYEEIVLVTSDFLGMFEYYKFTHWKPCSCVPPIY